MKKILKIAGITLATLVGLLIAAAIVLTLVFDPNQHKDDIIKLVREKTGRELKIEKKIGWSFYPSLGIEAGGVALSNAPGFGKDPFAKIEAAGVSVALLPLFSGRVEVGKLYLHGLNLNLAKNTAGHSNWEDLAGADKGPKPADKEKKEPGDSKLPVDAIRIGRVEIKRANLLWTDAQAGSTMAVRNLELTTGRFVSGEPMDMKLGLELDRDRNAPVKIALTSRLTVSPDALQLANVELRVDDSRLVGSMGVHNLASPALRFDLALDKIDLDRYLAGGKPAAKTADKGARAAEKPTEVPHATLRSLNVDGKLRIQELKAMGLRSNKVKVVIQAKNGVVSLGPNSAKLYGGSYAGQTVLDARGKVLQLQLAEKLTAVQLGPLLKDMQLFDHYQGAGNVELKLTAQGFGANQVKRSLNGNASVSVKDGRIDGVNLGKFIKTLSTKGDTLTKATNLLPEKGDHTIFGQMNATFQIANGVANNRDLVIRAAEFTATGKGSANLVSESMDYRLDLANLGNEGKKCKTFPVKIDGPFSNLSYLPDLEALLKCQATKQVEKGLQKGLEELLDNNKKKKNK